MTLKIILLGAAMASLSVPAFAQTTNHAPVCVPKTVTVGAAPEGVDMISLNVSPFALLACSDEDGDTMTVIATDELGTLADNDEIIIPYPDDAVSSYTVNYTVADSKGATASSTITVQRQ